MKLSGWARLWIVSSVLITGCVPAVRDDDHLLAQNCALFVRTFEAHGSWEKQLKLLPYPLPPGFVLKDPAGISAQDKAELDAAVRIAVINSMRSICQDRFKPADQK
jgi:hypothetical protein